MVSALCLLLLPLTAGLVTGCGASSTKSTKLTADTTPATSTSTSSATSARSLLSQAFDGQQKLTSGDLSLVVKIVPSGSALISTPITLSVAGPFQSAGEGKLPSIDLTISGSAQGHTGSLQLVLAGGKAYVTMDAQSYAVPAADLAQLESRMAASSTSENEQAGRTLLSQLGIDPSTWLSDPTVVGTANLDAVATTHVHATVDIGAMLQDVNKLLAGVGKTSSTAGLGGLRKLSKGISATDQAEIEKELGTPSFDAWIGNSDKILRRMRISATIPVSGSMSAELGGLKSAAISFSYDMNDVNQPQTITAPTSVRPFAQLLTKLHSLAAELLGSAVIQHSNSGGVVNGFGSGGGSGAGSVS